MSDLREKLNIEDGRYTTVWNNPLGLIPFSTCIAVVSLLVFYFVYRSDADGKWVVYIICTVLFLYMLLFLKGYFTFSYDIYLEDKRIRSFSMLRQVFTRLREWNLRYEDIERITAHSNFGAWMIELTPQKGASGTRLYISSGIIGFGELVECIMDRATNCREIRNLSMLKKMISRSDIWEKEPDWTIINSAIRRAAENSGRAPVHPPSKNET